MTHDRIVIGTSKRKSMVLLFGYALVVAACVWLAFPASDHEISVQEKMKLTGYAGLILSAPLGFYVLSTVFDRRPGMIIDNSGIYTRAARGHFIAWEIISGIRIEKVKSTKFILIELEDPEQFISGAAGAIKRKMEHTYARYGTPIAIAASTFDLDTAELVHLIRIRFNRRNLHGSK